MIVLLISSCVKEEDKPITSESIKALEENGKNSEKLKEQTIDIQINTDTKIIETKIIETNGFEEIENVKDNIVLEKIIGGNQNQTHHGNGN